MIIGHDLLLKAIVESTVDGIILINCKGLIQFVNEATCTLFGYESAELEGNTMNILLPDVVKHTSHDGYLKNYLQTGQAKVIGIGREVMGKRKDGSTFPFWLSIKETKMNEKTYFTGFIHDLSVQKKTERVLTSLTKELEEKVIERTKELAKTVKKLLKINLQLGIEIKDKEDSEIALKNTEETLRSALQKEILLNEMKTRFLSMASHEFKTPLSTILSSASILKRYTLTEQQGNRNKHIEKIKRMISQLNDILNDFLSIERLDGNEIEMVPTDFMIKPFLTNIIEEMEGMLKHGQSIQVSYLTNEEDLKQDSNILRTILRNLISNAVKYSMEGKKILIEVDTTASNVIFRIEDKGIGIPDEEQPYIFTRFFRSGNAANIKGTGLGLAIIERYLNVLGGKISFKSKLKEGSTFEVTIPKYE